MYPYRKNPLLKKKCTRSKFLTIMLQRYIHTRCAFTTNTRSMYKLRQQGLLRIDSYTERIKPNNDFSLKSKISSFIRDIE